jgi:hypothetical protein
MRAIITACAFRGRGISVPLHFIINWPMTAAHTCVPST